MAYDITNDIVYYGVYDIVYDIAYDVICDVADERKIFPAGGCAGKRVKIQKGIHIYIL
jgi:hypothetical protein